MQWSQVFKILGYACTALAAVFAYNSMTPAPEPKPVPPAINLSMPVIPNRSASPRDAEQDAQIIAIFNKLKAIEEAPPKSVSQPVLPRVDPPNDPGQAPVKVEEPKAEVPVTVPQIDSGETSQYANDVVPWQYDLEEAKTLSKKLNRPILICFTTDGCGPCEIREKFVYPVSRVWQKMHREFIATYLHVNETMNHSEANRYGITRYPRVVIDDGVSKPKVFMPADSPDEFLKQLK